ncbi:DUF802 domain-containing protein [Cupriavidus sp. SZY C1]|uniref:DUF802 domain-containing protein n=1 Tax=Cupriavidus sp. SZY C1 TaxID=3055037 RepID=UPI0028BBE371|nr:DUF802 domain-containing protein [Cupriavidus sp. SZY C1]MDT6961293.1 DUF802 domain-containing protein [Cupriavidus sp. SZY C1]
MNRHLTSLAAPVVFLAGLAVVGWVGAGYAGTNALALAVTLLIGGFYVGGALELHRYRQATPTLTAAIAALSTPPASLGAWLDRLHPSLRNAVRLRVEGERVALPGPAMTPYLVGLLVLLGMLGTFLGMVGTLRSTGVALEGAADLQAIRASLAAPVKGLGFAFGTSVAGVATSAMLGLLSTMARRERVQAAQLLDEQLVTTLRGFSRHHQHDAVFALLQRQAELMPALVDRLDTMATTLASQHAALGQRLADGQDAFHARTDAAYARLAETVGASLKDGIADSARAASAAIQPAVDTTMAGLAREASALRDAITQTVQQHLDGTAARFESTTAAVADTWRASLADHRQANGALAADLRATLDGFGETFAQRSAALVDGIGARLDTATADAARTWDAALSRLADTGTSLASANRAAMTDASAAFSQHAAAFAAQATDFAGTVRQSHADLHAQLAAQETARQSTLDSRDAARLAAWQETLAAMASTMREQWQAASAQSAADQQAVRDALSQSARDIATHAQAHATGTLAEIDRLLQAAASLQADLAARDAQRLTAWQDTLATMAATMRDEWQAASTASAGQQRALHDALADTAREIATQTQQQASDTIAEVARLAQIATEAPKAAAEVIAELRQKLTDGMARDNAMLEERGRLLETLGTLLDAVNHASTEQRAAVDGLVTTTADLLDRVGTRFTEQVAQETGKLDGIAARITGSAVEVASLGEAFGMAVQMFSASNDKLAEHLARIEAALDKSMARSDEQLAYYVAQAREVVDLSMLSQKQILENLQQFAARQAGAEAA